jgi:hypothetical protein
MESAMRKIIGFIFCLTVLFQLQGCAVHTPYAYGPNVSIGYSYPAYAYTPHYYRPGWSGYGGWRGGNYGWRNDYGPWRGRYGWQLGFRPGWGAGFGRGWRGHY